MPSSTPKSSVSTQNAVLVFAELRSEDRKKILPKMRKLIKAVPGHKFTPELVQSETLERAMKKDLKHGTKKLQSRLAELEERLDEVKESMSLTDIQTFVNEFSDASSKTYVEFKILAIMVFGFYSSHREMKKRFAAVKFVDACRQIVDVGIEFWEAMEENECNDPEFQLLMRDFEQDVGDMAVRLVQNGNGVSPTDQPWLSASPDTSRKFRHVFKNLEETVLGEILMQQEDEIEAQVETTSPTTGRILARRSPSGLTDSPGRLASKKSPDSFDEYLNGGSFF